MPRETITFIETRSEISYRDAHGAIVATVRPGSVIAAAITLGLSQARHALKDGTTGEYVVGNLDELMEGGA